MAVLQTPSKPLGSALKHLRLHYHLSVRQLADLAGIHRNTIWNVERHRTRRLDPSTLNRLSGAFGISREELDAALGLLPFGRTAQSAQASPEPEIDRSVGRLSPNEQRLITVFRDLTGVQQHLFEGLLLYYHGLRYLPDWGEVAAAYQGSVEQNEQQAGATP